MRFLGVAVAALAALAGAEGVRVVPELLPLEGNNHRSDPLRGLEVPAGLTPFSAARFRVEKLGGVMHRLKEKTNAYGAERVEKEGAARVSFDRAQKLYDAYAVSFREYLNTPEADRKPDELLQLGEKLREAQADHFKHEAAWLRESGDVFTEQMALDLDRGAVENAVGRLHRQVAMLTRRLKK